MSFKLEGIDINHDLAVTPAERLRHGSAGHARDLVADGVLTKVAQLSFIHTFTLQGDEADRETGGIEFQNHWWKRARRKATQVCRGEVCNDADCVVSIHPGLKVDFNQADTWQRTRLDMVDATCQSKKPLKSSGNIILNLFRGHPGEKRGYNYNGYVNRRKKIDRHPD